MDISFKNIKTNNLKNIDYNIKQNSISVIIGTSGCGKSSLAFETIGNLCQSEFKKLGGDFNTKVTYDLEEYNKLLVSISLKQLNYNKNPRSTIGTYYGLDRDIKRIFVNEFNLNIQDLSFNKYNSMCKRCSGLGYIAVPDENRVIDFSKLLKDNPFLPWNNTLKDYHNQMILHTIDDYKLHGNRLFYELPEKEQQFLLHGSGDKKYKINYNQSGRKRVKTSKYKGIIKDIEEEFLDKNNKAIIENYGKEITCPECRGGRLSNKNNKYKINGMNVSDLLTMDFIDLYNFLLDYEKKQDVNLQKREIKNIINMKLEYLNLNRSISSLSGGELQRLQLSRLLNSGFTGLLIILDEPLSNIHILEKEDILKKIVCLKEKNTIIIVEHNDMILPYADKVTALGPKGGINGGKIINKKEYIEDQKLYKNKILNLNGNKNISDTITIDNSEKVNNLEEFSIKIPKYKLIGISGPSGSGKSTLLKNVLPKNINGYKYVSQKPIVGNIYSTVGSYLGVLSDIRELYAKENNVDQSLFSYHFSGLGKCDVCNGTGELKLDSYDLKDILNVCPECDGQRYNKKALEHKHKDLNIFEFLNKTIDEILNTLEDKDSKLIKRLTIAKDLSLGHLRLIQEITTLSGGENQRIKILGNLNINATNEIIGLDEPFKGLDNKNIYKLLLFFYKLIDKQKWTIIFVEHNILSLSACQYLIDIGPKGGKNGGKIIFHGNIEEAKNNNVSSISNYLL